jgi:hypothetical protein
MICGYPSKVVSFTTAKKAVVKLNTDLQQLAPIFSGLEGKPDLLKLCISNVSNFTWVAEN